MDGEGEKNEEDKIKGGTEKRKEKDRRTKIEREDERRKRLVG